MRVSRLVIGTGVLLLAGVASTVLVSWAAALWFLIPMSTEIRKSDLRWHAPIPKGWPSVPKVECPGEDSWFGRAWIQAGNAPDGPVEMDVMQHGFPCPALGSEIVVDYRPGHEDNFVRFSCEAPLWLSKSVNGTTTTLPLRPLWPGFAIDTAVFSVLALLLVRCPRWIRGRLRATRGRCAACGYDLTGAPSPTCPECGGGKPAA